MSLTAQADQVDVSPSGLTFPLTAVGASSAPQTITMTNVALTRTVQVNEPTSPSECTLFDRCPFNMVANASCTYSITFTPTRSGRKTGTITFTENDFNGNSFKQTVAVTGIAH